MPSRINMGPDGGPYIAINENNGNIELEDNTGTTVAIWDDANSQWDFQNNPISNVDSLTSNSVNTTDTTTETVSVPSDQATLPDALARASQIYRSREAEVVINIETGFNPTGVEVEQGDWSFVRITSDDSTVTVSSEFSGDFIRARAATAPVLDCIIDMDGRGATGVYLERGSSIYVKIGAGVVNAGTDGISARHNSHISAAGADFHGATDFGAYISHRSTAALKDSKLYNAGQDALYVSRASVVYATGTDGSLTTDLSGAGRHGVRAGRACLVHAQYADISDAGTFGVWSWGSSRVNVQESEITGAGDVALMTKDTSLIDAYNSTLSATNYVGRALNGAELNIGDATVQGTVSNGFDNKHFQLERGGQIWASNATVDPNSDGTGTDLDSSHATVPVLNEIHPVGIVYNNQVDTETTAVRVRTTSTTSVPSGEFTKVPFDGSIFVDTDAYTFDSANHEITVEIPGDYKIESDVLWDSDSGWSQGDETRVAIYVNGANEYQVNNPKGNTARESKSAGATFDLSAGDTVHVEAFQFSGSLQAIFDSSSTKLELTRQ